MNKIIIICTSFISMLLSIDIHAQSPKGTIDSINQLLERKQFIRVDSLLQEAEPQLPIEYVYYVKAALATANNQIEKSENYLKTIHPKDSNNLPDSIIVKLLQITEDNKVKRYQYEDAYKTDSLILKDYGNYISTSEKEDILNNQRIWDAMRKFPAQKIIKHGNTQIQLLRDKGGLQTLKVHSGKDSLDFVFDTGANLSTITRSSAKKLGMTILPVNINVGASTGDTTVANVAYCPLLKIGNIDIKNTFFLVVEDKNLSFPEIDYKINGIIGIPIMADFGEMTLTRDGKMTIPFKSENNNKVSNMRMEGYNLLIYLAGDPYTFDSGAGKTVLYKNYYDKYLKDTATTSDSKVSFGGAAGRKEFDGIRTNASFRYGNEIIKLKEVSVLKKHLPGKAYAYGNIGQDFIGHFSKMTINFNKMFISFE